MTTNTDTTAASGAAPQPEPLRLAAIVNSDGYITNIERRQIGAELRRLHALTTAAPAAQEAEPVGYWVSFPDEPELELGHWFSEEPCGEGYLSLPLYTHPPRPQADAGAVAEGCTPADAQILRKANHGLAAESFELQQALRGIVAQAGGALARFDIAPQADAGAVAVPEGWRLVPVEPTLQMDEAGYATLPDRHRWLGYELFRVYYRAMLAAAPQAPAAPTAAAGAYAPLPKPYSAAAALGLDDLYTGDDMRAYADAHRAAPAPAAGEAPTDAEIDAVWKEGALRKDAEPSIRGQFRWAARAVLARWGAAAPAPDAPRLIGVDMAAGPDATAYWTAGAAAPTDALGAVLDAFERKERGRLAATIAASLVEELRAAMAAAPAQEAAPLTHAELLEIRRAVDDIEDCGETDVDYDLLLRAAMAGYLECTRFQVLDQSALDRAAARARQEGGAG